MTYQDQTSQAATTPERALTILSEGNQRFRAGRQAERNLLQQVEGTAGGQWPFAVVLACVDSRVSPELVFDLGIGDAFSARVAGNFVNDDILGSMEFACALAGAKVVVVLGHTHCGAIKGACDKVELGKLTGLLRTLAPAVDGTPEPTDPKQRSSQNPTFVQAVAERNVELTIEAIRTRSDVLRELEDGGKIRVVGAMYDVETGAVDFRD